MKRTLVIVCVGIGLASVLVLAFMYVKGTPHYSIYQLARAVRNHDADGALKYIDIDALSESLARSLLTGGEAKKKPGKEVMSAVSMNMPSINEGLRLFLIAVIRDPRSADVAAQDEVFGFGDLDIHDAGAGIVWRLDIRREDGSAVVTVRGKPGQRARMVKTGDGYWKFVEIMAGEKGKD